MSRELTYSIHLTSDAEPSTGLGAEMTNARIPRSKEGLPFIPASHIKGLMRQAIVDLIERLNPEGAERSMARVFGTGGEKLDDEAVFSLADAICDRQDAISTVTRTSITKYGTAKKGSLRTTERIAAGSMFRGTIRFSGEPSPLSSTMLCYALLSVMEIGGSRNRGCGACYIIIDGDERTPGAVLQTLLPLISQPEEPLVQKIPPAKIQPGNPQRQIALKLSFTAKGPLCVPENPVVDGTNTLCSGFVIPASAVQGILLHRIDAINKATADACFASDHFRVWPLQPTIPNSNGFSVRVPTSQRISKLPSQNGDYLFGDDIIAEGNSTVVPDLPMKSVDGVLASGGRKIKLWNQKDMPRHISAHAVINSHDKKRNLFTVESIAVLESNGLVLLPEDAAECLIASLEENPLVMVGKARSIRGSGSLKPERLPDDFLPSLGWECEAKPRVFIIQSPIVIKVPTHKIPAHKIIKDVVEAAGWGEVEVCSGAISLLFGWNRHQKDKGRQEAIRIIQPGAIFKLKEPPANVRDLLCAGLGGERQRGCGAVLPHPGQVTPRDRSEVKHQTLPSSDQAGRIGWQLFNQAKTCGLSKSQIGGIGSELENNGANAALAYLQRQKLERPERIWDRWQPMIKTIEKEIQTNPQQAARSLKVWQDLTSSTQLKGGSHA